MKLFYIVVFFCFLYCGDISADIIYLKNGSFIEGKIVEENKTSISVELTSGTIVIQRSNIIEIVKAEVMPKEDSKANQKQEIKKVEVIKPEITKTSKPISTIRDAPLVLNDEGKKPAQKEINSLLRKLVGIKESDDPWEFAEKLVVRSKDESAYLLELLGGVQNREGLKWLIYVTSQLQIKESVKLFYEMLKTEEDEPVRIALIEALGRIKEVSTIDLLRRQLVVEKSNKAKIAIINMLGTGVDIESLSILLGILDDEDDELSHTAALAIMRIYRNAKPQEIEDIDFMAMLVRVMNNAELKGKKEILSILGQIKNKDTIDLMVKYLDDKDANVRSEAVKALAVLRDNDILEVLVNRLDYEKDLWTKMQIIQAMGSTNNQSMIPKLIELLLDAEPKTRESAARSLGQLTKKYFGDNYEIWKEWWRTTQGEH
jgi:HEAT repeat protein